jgi:hypothetical protein
VFDDNVEFARLDGVTRIPRDIRTSDFAGRYLKGKMRRLTVWNRALSADEIAALRR